VTDVLPDDHGRALLVGRIHDPEKGGPSLVAVRGDELVDLTSYGPTMSDLLERPDRLEVVRTGDGRRWPVAEVVEASVTDATRPHLLAPVDLQVIKAAGVTFAKSMIERVIEERAGGDAQRADEIRQRVEGIVGDAITGLEPGSEEAEKIKQVLIEEQLWSQYLEVGIGPDPEIFTKAPVLSAVGHGADVGVLERSTWNNPEPEVVLLCTSAAEAVGATLGNDVNLRDFEGRSALLLTEAKDNNASCAIGPFVRLFDKGFGLDDVRKLEVELTITGVDGFELHERSLMSQMSRRLEDLVSHACGPHHRYPDGFALFTGTLFAPTQDRDTPGVGFTHHLGDVVRISNPALGALTNTVSTAEASPDWEFGIRGLMSNLAARGLLAGAVS
jgi:fumarylacetoacetate (FAA) hydrolase family protein